MAPRKSKPTGTPEEMIDTSLVPAVPPKKEIVLEGDPEAQLAYATKAANALMSVVSKKKKKVLINGKEYLEYGDWQVLGRFYGSTVEIEWTKPVERDGKLIGYEARANVLRNGEIISTAEGMCTTAEKRWADADEYAVRSMAQTRTAAKALRNAFGWVAELAGYSATPAEEMPRDIPKDNYQGAVIDLPDYDGHAEPPEVAGGDPVDPVFEQRLKIRRFLQKRDIDIKDRAACESVVADLTDLALVPENFAEIIIKLDALDI